MHEARRATGFVAVIPGVLQVHRWMVFRDEMPVVATGPRPECRRQGASTGFPRRANAHRESDRARISRTGSPPSGRFPIDRGRATEATGLQFPPVLSNAAATFVLALVDLGRIYRLALRRAWPWRRARTALPAGDGLEPLRVALAGGAGRRADLHLHVAMKASISASVWSLVP